MSQGPQKACDKAGQAVYFIFTSYNKVDYFLMHH